MPACTLAIYVNDQVYVHIMHICICICALYVSVCVYGQKIKCLPPTSIDTASHNRQHDKHSKKNMAQNSMKQ